MPVVYLIAQPAISRHKKPPVLDPLYGFGEVRVIIPTGKSPTYNIPETYEIVDGKLANFDPEKDYFVWAGGDVLCAIFVGLWLAEHEIWEFNWLRYERRRLEDGTRTDDGAGYSPVRIDLRESGIPTEYDGEESEHDENGVEI